MRKLIVLQAPESHNALGGTTVSLSLMIKGFAQHDAIEQLCVPVLADSLLEQYLRQAGQASCMQLIQVKDQSQFMKDALAWIRQQPHDWPLLLESCISRRVLRSMALAAPTLRLSGRPIYHFFHDLASSYNPLGNLFRKLIFASLSPGAICNSQFTANHVRNNLVSEICGVLYQPVDLEQFNNCPPAGPPPAELEPILRSGARIMLTPSRISKPEKFNDKNLRGLIPVLADLKSAGHNYHGVVIGQDFSPNQTRTRVLLEFAEHLGVADRFTVLPPTFAIKDYYQYADVVVTLAPREPFGRVVVEAIACGVPVIGSRTGGIGETLGHFAPEWTVEPADPVAAAEAIVRVANDPQTSNLLAKGRHWVETECSPMDYAHKLMKITGLSSTRLSKTSSSVLVS